MPLASPNARLSFTVERHLRLQPSSPWIITPHLDSVSLATLVTEFERREQFDPPLGGYAGLIPDYFNFGPLDRYFLSEFESDSYFAKYPIYLLGCECGEVGCWPLTCEIKVARETITWHRFAQPHRKERDYWHFGPFVFDATQYREAVADLVTDYSVKIANDNL